MGGDFDVCLTQLPSPIGLRKTLILVHIKHILVTTAYYDMGHISDASRYFNRSLLLSVLVIAVSTFNYGFDNQAFATTQAMDAFTKKFGTYDKASGTYELNSVWLSLFNSLNYIGFVVGEWHFLDLLGIPCTF